LADGYVGGCDWVSLREQLDPLPPIEAAFWATLRRWDLRDPDGWPAPLTEYLAELVDQTLANTLADELKPLFSRFAASDLRMTLAAAEECLWDVEFLLDLRAVAAAPDVLIDSARDPLPILRGLIDFLYRDATGWHIVALHVRELSGRNPWTDRKPGLAAAAWAVREQMVTPPQTVALLDLVAGGLRVEAVKRLKYSASFTRIIENLRVWCRRPSSPFVIGEPE
jgi:hypothetical protein